MKFPPCSSQLRSHSRTGHDSASGSGVIVVKELIRNSLTRGPETAFGVKCRVLPFDSGARGRKPDFAGDEKVVRDDRYRL